MLVIFEWEDHGHEVRGGTVAKLMRDPPP